jgi:hypothetical protein
MIVTILIGSCFLLGEGEENWFGLKMRARDSKINMSDLRL